MAASHLRITLVSTAVDRFPEKPELNPNDKSQPVFAALDAALARLRAANLETPAGVSQKQLEALARLPAVDLETPAGVSQKQLEALAQADVRVGCFAPEAGRRTSVMRHCVLPMPRLTPPGGGPDKEYYMWVEATVSVPVAAQGR